MINFELDGTQYRICFKHYDRDWCLYQRAIMPNPKHTYIGATSVTLEEYGDTGESVKNWMFVDSAVSYCCAPDIFKKSEGRKLALARLLSFSLYFNSSFKEEVKSEEGESRTVTVYRRNRDLRLKIWRLYFDKVRAAESEKFWASQRRQEHEQ